MNYSRAFRTAALLVFSLSPWAQAQDSSRVNAGQNWLEVKPNRCIALRQGQYCYQKLKFHWQVPEAHKYCLYSSQDEAPLVCWKGTKLSEYEHEFKSLEGQMFVLRDESTKSDLSEVEVDVSWVYKSSKKVSTGWRLF